MPGSLRDAAEARDGRGGGEGGDLCGRADDGDVYWREVQQVCEEVEEAQREEGYVPPGKLEWRERASAIRVLRHACGNVEGWLWVFKLMCTYKSPCETYVGREREDVAP